MAKCPACGTDLEWGWCEKCEREIPEGEEIDTEPTSHPWIVGEPMGGHKMTAEELAAHREQERREEGARLAAQLEALKAANGGKLPEIKINPEDFKIYADTDYG